MIDMYKIENVLYSEGYNYICGVDEAGRGPLAGPVVAAAVILPRGIIIEGVNDSKKVSPKNRDRLFDEIIEKSLAYSIAFADHNEIDEHNILAATLIAMNRAVESLSFNPDYVLIDGNTDPKNGLLTRTVIGGDGVSASIAAASILAKVYRDRLMTELDIDYPEYLFAKHKGYPTKVHYEKIIEHGICPVHRMSFLKKLISKYPNIKICR